VLAALGPKMLSLAAHRAGGAHPYLVTPDHTRLARAALGEGPLLLPEQTVKGADHVCIQVLTADPSAFPRDQWRRVAAALA
jgi:hypothetical protein